MDTLVQDGSPAEAYDYIIIGAGSAGCVLAHRLSADPKVRVLLLEAGPSDRHPFVHMPRALVKLLGDDRFVWTYKAEPVAGGRNDPHHWVRGKLLGGSSSINGMLYVRGQPEDYDEWEDMGAAGWGWSNMLRSFKAIEDHALGGNDSRGAGGPLHVTIPQRRQELCDAFIAAISDHDVPAKQDLNEGEQTGAGYYPYTIKGGRRFSAARAFLNPVRSRPNLKVMTGFTVERIRFEGKRAVGVVCRDKRSVRHFHAREEVILAAGGLNSPILLQQSGIGNAAQLLSLGIEVVQHLPGVGENMLEHWLLPIEYRLRRAGSTNAEYRGARLAFNLARYYLLGTGPMTEGAYEAGAFIRTISPKRADAQLLFGPFTIDRSAGFTIDRLPGAQCCGLPLRPRSKGSVKIASPDPHVPAIVKPNYLTDRYDQQVSVATYRFIQRLFEHPSIAPYICSQLSPSVDFRSDDEILHAYRTFGVSGYHAAGTCRMGSDPDAVVDQRLRVRGVTGLRVMDCSVMPTMVSGNTNGPVMAMAWHAADLILADRAAARLPQLQTAVG